MLKKESELKNRSHYLEKLIEFKDNIFLVSMLKTSKK